MRQEPSNDTRLKPRRDAHSADPDFWEQYGWHTTISVCVGIGAFGLLQLLAALVLLPTHPAVDIIEHYLFFAIGPLLTIIGITAFLLPVQSLVQHYFVE
jgi:hypothetical protein